MSGQPDRAEPLAIDETLIDTGLVRVGRFRVSSARPDFATLGAITRHVFVFPRRAVWIRHAGSPAFVADPTRVTMYNPGAEYRREQLDPAGDYSDWFSLDADVMRQAIEYFDPDRLDRGPLFGYTHARVDATLYLRQRRVYQYVRHSPDRDPLLVEEAVLSLLASVVASATGRTSATGGPQVRASNRHGEIAEAACAVLNRTFAATTSLSSIAGQVGVSVFHLCRLFRRSTGGTIHWHREQLRLRSSLPAILETDEDLLSIGLRLGYCSHSHFTATFRRWFRCAPSEMRKKRAMGSHEGQRWLADERRT